MLADLAPLLMLLLCALPVLGALTGALWLTRRLQRDTDPSAVPITLGPQALAYLRGGMTAFVRYQLANLIARGWLVRCDDEGAFSSSISPCYRAAARPPSPALLKGAQQELWIILEERGLITENMHLHELAERLAPFGEELHRELARAGMLVPYEAHQVHRRRVRHVQRAIVCLGAILTLLIWPTSHTLAIFEAGLTLLVVISIRPLGHPSRAWTERGRASVAQLVTSYDPMRRAPWRWKKISLRDRDFLIAIHSSR